MMRRAPEGVTTFHELVGWNFDTQDVIIYLYLMALCLALFTLFVSNRVIRMPIGRAWEALREDEIACRSLGLNPTRIKLSAFTMGAMRSEEHTSELQSLMRISYAVFCLKKKKNNHKTQ